jgi:hypothetical protein
MKTLLLVLMATARVAFGGPDIKILGSGDFVDTDKVSPLQLIEALKTWKFEVPFEAPVEKWIKPEHVVELIQLLNCNDKSAPVGLAVSSFHEPKLSTVSHEASYMIIGYFEGRYPPSLHSVARDMGGKKKAVELVVAALSKREVPPERPPQKGSSSPKQNVKKRPRS